MSEPEIKVYEAKLGFAGLVAPGAIGTFRARVHEPFRGKWLVIQDPDAFRVVSLVACPYGDEDHPHDLGGHSGTAWLRHGDDGPGERFITMDPLAPGSVVVLTVENRTEATRRFEGVLGGIAAGGRQEGK